MEEVGLLGLSVMQGIKLHAVPALSGYAKFTISPTISGEDGSEPITYTPTGSIPLRLEGGSKPVSDPFLFCHILTSFFRVRDAYLGLSTSVRSISVHVYCVEKIARGERKTPF